MSTAVEYLTNKASEGEIAAHLLQCDADFVPRLSARIGINDYAIKISSKAMRFEAWSGGTLIGLLAAYCNDNAKRIAYVTTLSVLKEWMGKGIGSRLMRQCVAHATTSGMEQISLEVAADNAPAVKFYEKSGFIAGKANTPFVLMSLYLKTGEENAPEA